MWPGYSAFRERASLLSKDVEPYRVAACKRDTQKTQLPWPVSLDLEFFLKRISTFLLPVLRKKCKTQN